MMKITGLADRMTKSTGSEQALNILYQYVLTYRKTNYTLHVSIVNDRDH